MPAKKEPLRQCIGCMEMKSKKELVRIDKLTKRRNEIRNNLLTKKNELDDVCKKLPERLKDYKKPTNYIIDITDKEK